MTTIFDQLKSVSGKLHQLLKQHDAIQKDNERLKARTAALESDAGELQQRLSDLQQQNLVLKASLQSLEPAEKKELEQRLSQYIKNIDKSISLLSQ